MKISPDRLDTKNLPEVLGTIQSVLQERGVDFFLVGAQARDIQLLLHGGRSARATRDVDIALTVPGLKAFNSIKRELADVRGFEARDNETPYRLRHKRTGLVVDLLPFGQISKSGIVQFDDRLKTKLVVTGLREAFNSAEKVTLAGLELKVATLPGIFVMKLLSWHIDPDNRDRDAKDLRHILCHYFEMNQSEIFDYHFELLESLEPAKAGARVLGRHIKKLLMRSAKTCKIILEILQKNSQDPATSLLGERMVIGTNRSVAEICSLLAETIKGIKHS